MPAVIRWPPGCHHGGSIRLGPECFAWHDPYTRLLSFEIERVNVAVIGGLTKPPLTRQEYRWVGAALRAEGLIPKMERAKRNRQPYRVKMANPVRRPI